MVSPSGSLSLAITATFTVVLIGVLAVSATATGLALGVAAIDTTALDDVATAAVVGSSPAKEAVFVPAQSAETRTVNSSTKCWPGFKIPEAPSNKFVFAPLPV